MRSYLADTFNADGTPNMNTNQGRVASADLAARALGIARGRIILIPARTVTITSTVTVAPVMA